MLVTFLLWLVYFTAQILHVLLGAHLAIKSKLNGLCGLRGYLAARWIPIVCRVFLASCTFAIVWANPFLFNMQKFVSTPTSQVALAGILGWFSDSLFDKVVGMLPGLQKEIPALPDDGAASTAAPKD